MGYLSFYLSEKVWLPFHCGKKLFTSKQFWIIVMFSQYFTDVTKVFQHASFLTKTLCSLQICVLFHSFRTYENLSFFPLLSTGMVAAPSSYHLPNVKQFMVSNFWVNLSRFRIRVRWLSCEIGCEMCSTVHSSFVDYPAFSHC